MLDSDPKQFNEAMKFYYCRSLKGVGLNMRCPTYKDVNC